MQAAPLKHGVRLAPQRRNLACWSRSMLRHWRTCACENEVERHTAISSSNFHETRTCVLLSQKTPTQTIGRSWCPTRNQSLEGCLLMTLYSFALQTSTISQSQIFRGSLLAANAKIDETMLRSSRLWSKTLVPDGRRRFL